VIRVIWCGSCPQLTLRPKNASKSSRALAAELGVSHFSVNQARNSGGRNLPREPIKGNDGKVWDTVMPQAADASQRAPPKMPAPAQAAMRVADNAGSQPARPCVDRAAEFSLAPAPRRPA